MPKKIPECVYYIPYNLKNKKVVKNGHSNGDLQEWDYCDIKSIPSIFNSIVLFNRSNIKEVLKKLNKKDNCFKALKIKISFEETTLIG